MLMIGDRLPFFTPLRYYEPTVMPSSQCDILNPVENYFNWGNTFAIGTLDGKEIALVSFRRYSSKAQEVFFKILLVLSYATAIVPLIMLIAKAILRSGTQDFRITETETFNAQSPVNQENNI